MEVRPPSRRPLFRVLRYPQAPWLLALTTAWLLGPGCHKSPNPPPRPPGNVFVAGYGAGDLDVDTGFLDGQASQPIGVAGLQEASGLASSAVQPGLLYSVNDSDNPDTLYLLATDGSAAGAFGLAVPNRDWEDLAVGPGPAAGTSYVFVADIGDNSGRWPAVHIYRFEEPVKRGEMAPRSGTVKVIDDVALHYPDGAHDAEAFFVDPITRDWYIITKSLLGTVYRAAFPQVSGQVLARVGVLPFPLLVAADMSPDGRELLLKDYAGIYGWTRKAGETVDAMLQRAPLRLPYTVEPQGESVAWASDGSGYFTLSEQRGDTAPSLYLYRRR